MATDKADLERGLVQVDPARCKTCWNTELGSRCTVPYELGYELFRSERKIALGPHLEKMPLPPCVAACPANICVMGYVGLIAAGLYEQAYRLIRARVPFPHVLSLVCPHPCEDHCIRGDYDQPIAINALKRFAVEKTPQEVRRRFLEELITELDENGQKVAVVGAGPAGLAAAHDLRLRGYAVTVFEKLERPGGMMLTGIPGYRLPRAVLEEEIGEVLELGVELKTGVGVGEDLPLRELLSGYDAVFLAIGAHLGAKLNVPGEEAEGVWDALKLLRLVNLGGEKPVLGLRAVVIGGGDSAVDGARVARRLGAREVWILYRRTRTEMPAHPEQLAQAEAEGVQLWELVSPVEFITEGGRLRAVKLIKNKLGEPDESGRRRPVPIPGSEFLLEADAAIVAVGQRPELRFLELERSRAGGPALELDERGLVKVDPETMQTSIEKLFAGGDLVSGPSTVIEAIAAGKRAAWGIDRYLRGERAKAVCFRSLSELNQQGRYQPPSERVTRQARARMPHLPAAERVRDFRLVELGLDEEAAVAEARRCLACGLCAACNACLDTFACPAIFLDRDRNQGQGQGKPAIDPLLCDGCGVCPQLCPNDAIAVVEEPEEKGKGEEKREGEGEEKEGERGVGLR